MFHAVWWRCSYCIVLKCICILILSSWSKKCSGVVCVLIPSGYIRPDVSANVRVLIKALSYLTWQIYQFLHLGFFGVSNWGNTAIILTFFFWFNLCFPVSSNFGFMYVFSLTVFRYGYVLWFDVYVNRPCFVILFIVILVLSRRSLQSRTRSEYKRYSGEICGTLDLDLM